MESSEGEAQSVPPDGIVIDGSVTMAWCFPDEDSPYATAVLKSVQSYTICVPSIWPLEVANCLLVGERRQRLTQARSAQFIQLLAAFPIIVEPNPEPDPAEHTFRDILALARTQNLSAYDASYLSLAMRLGVPLATLD